MGLALLPSLSVCAVAHAEPTAAELGVARRAFSEAVELEKQEEWALAAQKLREAIAVKETPGLRFHLAHTEEKLGQLLEAAGDYARAKELIAAGIPAPDVERLLDKALLDLEERIPRVRVLLEPSVAGAEVRLDGRLQRNEGVATFVRLNPGAHRVLVTAPGYRSFEHEIDIQLSERRSVRVELVPEPRPTAPTPAQPSATKTPARRELSIQQTASPARTYVLVSESVVSLAALGVGVGFLLMTPTAADNMHRAQQNLDEVRRAQGDAACRQPKPPEACRRLSEAIDDYNDTRRITYVGLVGAGAGLTATVLTYLLWPRSRTTVVVSDAGAPAWLGVRSEF